MGGCEAWAPAWVEPPLEYHPCHAGALTCPSASLGGTVSGGQFNWGGCLLKGNGGAQRSPQHGWQSCVERKGIRWPDCEGDAPNREETRA